MEEGTGLKMAIRQKWRNLGLALALAGSLSACAALGGSAPSDIYDITSVRQFGNVGTSGYHIGVGVPAAVEALNTNRIAVRTSPLMLQYFGGGLWADELPNLVQARLIQSFENTGRLKGVSGTGGGIRSDFVVLADIRAFEARSFDRTAEVEIFVKLVNDRSARVVANRLFTVRVPSADTLQGATQALDTAFNEVAREIVEWTLGRI